NEGDNLGEGYFSDGDDRLFGDLGNDWLVGGTGRDNMYGGWGDDLINADDDHRSIVVEGVGQNDVPDTHSSYEDLAFGGAGRDRLIANTGGDRLIDWAGEFNSYMVPFAPFGAATISRALAPQIAEFLYDLSESDGADQTLGSDGARNGEPEGELGLVRQQDFAWRDQTGAPDDVQPGNIPGGARDVLRSADFSGVQSGGTAGTGFFADSGVFEVNNNQLRVGAESVGGDAVAVYHVGEQLPSYFEIQASVKMDKANGGWNANAYVVFDYQNEQDFKFVGIDDSTNKLIMGHRDASGWHVDVQGVVQGGVKPDKWYNMLVAINGVNVTLVVNNKEVFQHTFAPRIFDGYAYGLNWGLVGVGSDNARGSFDNVRVQILPPQVTFEDSDDFSGPDTGEYFTGAVSGDWSFGGGRYSVDPGGGLGMSLMDLGPNHLNFNAYLELNATVNTQGRAGFIFDRYGDTKFKFVAIDAASDELIIGHYTQQSGWVDDVSVSTTIEAGTDYALGVTLKGSTVSATLNGQGGSGYQAIAGHAFNAATVDGDFGLMATSGLATFDDAEVKTDDPAFVEAEAGAMMAVEEAAVSGVIHSAPTQAEIDGILGAVISQWIDVLGHGDDRLAALGDVKVTVSDLDGTTLAISEGNTITIDSDAAGHGWYVDLSPGSSEEFRIRLDDNVLAAHSQSEGWGGMDLVTVLAHEVGHVLGLHHEEAQDYAVMAGQLDAGTRYTFDRSTDDDQLAPQFGGADVLADMGSGSIGGDVALMRDEDLLLLTTAMVRGSIFDESGFDGTTSEQVEYGGMTSGKDDAVYLWLDFDVADEHHRYFDDEDDAVLVEDDEEQANEIYADWLMPDTNKGMESSEFGETGQTGSEGAYGQSGDATPAQLINWDDTLDGVGMSFTPFGDTKLSKYGPNILDYDYLALTRK
ncbi:MAG: matrixin family metalloprotease, partial [Burkholderiales bacterium]